MFEYLIQYRVDDEEYYCTECLEVKGNSVNDILDTIRRIEKSYTIIKISNLSI